MESGPGHILATLKIKQCPFKKDQEIIVRTPSITKEKNSIECHDIMRWFRLVWEYIFYPDECDTPVLVQNRYTLTLNLPHVSLFIVRTGNQTRNGLRSLMNDPGEQENRVRLNTAEKYPRIPARIDKIRDRML